MQSIAAQNRNISGIGSPRRSGTPDIRKVHRHKLGFVVRFFPLQGKNGVAPSAYHIIELILYHGREV